MSYPYYPPQPQYPMYEHTVPRYGTPHGWQAPSYDFSHTPYPYGECYQPPQWTHYHSQDLSSCSYPQYDQMYQESPPGDFYQPQWEGNYQEQWGENANYFYEENNQVEEINRQHLMTEIMRQMTELDEKLNKFMMPEPQQDVISPPIENCYLPSTIQPVCETDNAMALEDTSRYQLMTELMSQMIKLNDLVENRIAQQELQCQTIKSEVVEPPSPPHSPPQHNSLTSWASIHDRFAQSALLDDSSSEEGYSAETEHFTDVASSGDWPMEESPGDSKNDFRDNLIDESSSVLDSIDFHEPTPLSAEEVVSLMHEPIIPTLDSLSHPLFDMHVCPTLKNVVEGKNENDLDTCIPENFEIEKLLGEDSKILNDDFYSVHSKSMCPEQNSDSFDDILIDSVLEHMEGHKNSLINNLDPIPIVEPRSSPDLPGAYVENVEGIISTPEQNENLISSDPLDDALDDFLTSCGPLEFIVASKEVDEWIDLHNEKNLNEWEIHIDNFLGLHTNTCAILPLNVPNKLDGLVFCVISSDLEPDISWGEMQFYEDIPFLLTVKFFFWDDPQKFRLLLYDEFFD